MKSASDILYSTKPLRDIARLGQGNACFKIGWPASKFHLNEADIEYFWAKTCGFSHLPALTQNPGYATEASCILRCHGARIHRKGLMNC